MCEALGVSRGGFYAWLTRPRSQRSRSDEELGAKVRASFLASDRTYGARRVWRDLLADTRLEPLCPGRLDRFPSPATEVSLQRALGSCLLWWGATARPSRSESGFP